MRILAVSDEESRQLLSRAETGSLPHIDLIISCGDLHPSYLEELADRVNALLVYVRGNHSYGEMTCGICIEGKVFSYQGISIAGLGGSLRYSPGENQYTQKEMQRRMRRLIPRILLQKKLDILVTHAPARGYGDLEDIPHRGFEAFGDLLDRFRPQYMIHGHVHLNYGRISKRLDHPSGTVIINACGYQIIEI